MPSGGSRAGAGRPKGVPNKATREIKDAAQAYGLEALKVLVKAMRASEADATRVAAAEKVLDRAYGKPAQAQTGDDGGPIRHVVEVSWKQPSSESN